MKIQIKSIVILILGSLFYSCQNVVEFEMKCEEIRNGRLSRTYTKMDIAKRTKEGTINYNSSINLEKPLNREWEFLNPDSGLNQKHEYTLNGKAVVSKILGKREFFIYGKNYEVIKYRIDEVLSEDEESNKFYTTKFGIVLETYWKRNYIRSISVNGEKNKPLNELVDRIINDEKFMWDEK